MTEEIERHLTIARDYYFVEDETALEPGQILLREILLAARLGAGFEYDPRGTEISRNGDVVEHHAACLLLQALKDGNIRARHGGTFLPIHRRCWWGNDDSDAGWSTGEIPSYSDAYCFGHAGVLPYVDITDAVEWIDAVIQKIPIILAEQAKDLRTPPVPQQILTDPKECLANPAEFLTAMQVAVEWCVERDIEMHSPDRIIFAKDMGVSRDKARVLWKKIELPSCWPRGGRPKKKG